MSTSVTISGSTYDVPENGQSPSWGDDLHDVVVALANASNSASGPSDIPMTSFTVANNTSSVANITGASFDTTLVRSFILNYSVYRTTTTTEMSEVGVLYGTYKSTAATWDFSQQRGGIANITFTITSGGQLQYTTDNFGGSTYSGKMKFYAKSFLQA